LIFLGVLDGFSQRALRSRALSRRARQEKGGGRKEDLALTQSMHADPQRVSDHEPGPTLRLLEPPNTNTLARLMLRSLDLLRQAFWRAFQHDAFAIAKASAYSSILTFFPSLLAVGSVLASRRNTQALLGEISEALREILPTGTATAQAYLKKGPGHSLGVIVATSLLALWLA